MGLLKSRPQTKEEFRKQKISGLFQCFDSRNGRLREEGKFQAGVQVGLWKEYDSDGDQMHFQYNKQRVGGLCRDGTKTKATGRGAGSYHGGVSQWLYQPAMKKVGGTGKYMLPQTRVKILREKVRQKINTRKEGLELQQEILLQFINLTDKNRELQAYQRDIEKSMEVTLSNMKLEQRQVQRISDDVNEKYKKLEECLKSQKEKLKVSSNSFYISIVPAEQRSKEEQKQEEEPERKKEKSRMNHLSMELNDISRSFGNKSELKNNLEKLLKFSENIHSILKKQDKSQSHLQPSDISDQNQQASELSLNEFLKNIPEVSK